MTQTLSEALAATVRAERAARNMTQQQMADAAGMTFVSIRRYLRGEREINTAALWSIAKAFGVRPSYLMQQAEMRAGFVKTEQPQMAATVPLQREEPPS